MAILTKLVARLSPPLRKSLENGVGEAIKRKAAAVETGHFLFHILFGKDTELQTFLEDQGVNISSLQAELERGMPLGSGDGGRQPTISGSVTKLIEQAWLQASVEMNLSQITPEVFLLVTQLPNALGARAEPLKELKPISTDALQAFCAKRGKLTANNGPGSSGVGGPVNITGDGTALAIESGTGEAYIGSQNTSYFHFLGNRTFYFGNRCEANGGFHTYSDERLKENITPISDAIDKVSQMNGITFNWIDAENRGGGDPRKQFGVTAQNMLEVDSELPTLNKDPLASQDEINNEESTDYYTMDYNRITPFLIEAVKELKTELDVAKARITELEG